MRHVQIIVTATLLLMILASACTGAPTPSATAGSNPTPPATAASNPTPEATAGGEKNFEDFDPDNFDRSAQIDNQWMPLKPGTRYVYEGVTVEDDGATVPHRVEIHVTDLTKVIGGIRSVVTWDLDYSDGELVEAELAFFAQDKDGNVWRMGEYPEEYDAGKVVAAPTWIHGLQEARAGIMMKADPRTGTPSYSQGWGPAVNWTDRGQVDELGQKTCVPVNCYENVLVIAETSQSEPDAQQLKYYAPGVGNVRVGWRGAGEKTKETLELTSLEQLSPEALAEVRAKALELEKSAYEHSQDVYALTSPTEYPEGTPALAITPAASAPTQAPVEAESEVIVYASELPQSALSEFDFVDDPASPGGKLVVTPNAGGDLDPPPESDPHVTFTVQVQGGIPYRCWIHMKVGEPLGVSQANIIYAQFTNAADQSNNEILNVGTGSYMTAEGPTKPGWAWVECDRADSEAEPLVYFRNSGEVTVRLQAGMEGVGFDQFVLSSDRFLESSPTEPIVEK
jgi:hypothetical protein